MEKKVIDTLAHCLHVNEPVALVSLISSQGSSPGKTGAIMLVKQDGECLGTVGGGNLEKNATREAVTAISAGISKDVSYKLTADGDLGMSCGGEVHFFIKVFNSNDKLIIVGGGHIGYELYQLGLHQGFRVHVFDDRPELVTTERFPEAELTISPDVSGMLKEYNPGVGSYVTIATSSHETDKFCLEAVVDSSAEYVGMIGSTPKIRGILKYLLNQGVSRKSIDKLYVPMGLNIASRLPKEIAMSIMSEILLVKNNGTAEHMRQVKKVRL